MTDLSSLLLNLSLLVFLNCFLIFARFEPHVLYILISLKKETCIRILLHTINFLMVLTWDRIQNCFRLQKIGSIWIRSEFKNIAQEHLSEKFWRQFLCSARVCLCAYLNSAAGLSQKIHRRFSSGQSKRRLCY